MPYVSEAQRRYFHAHRAELEAQGVDVDEWDRASEGLDLPERVGDGASDDRRDDDRDANDRHRKGRRRRRTAKSASSTLENVLGGLLYPVTHLVQSYPVARHYTNIPLPDHDTYRFDASTLDSLSNIIDLEEELRLLQEPSGKRRRRVITDIVAAGAVGGASGALKGLLWSHPQSPAVVSGLAALGALTAGGFTALSHRVGIEDERRHKVQDALQTYPSVLRNLAADPEVRAHLEQYRSARLSPWRGLDLGLLAGAASSVGLAYALPDTPSTERTVAVFAPALLFPLIGFVIGRRRKEQQQQRVKERLARLLRRRVERSATEQEPSEALEVDAS